MNQTIILIVDDNAANLQTLGELLEPEGYQIIEAADGPTALRLAAESPPDLVLLDVMMPGMSGFEVCQRLRADALLAEVPIILITAMNDQASRLTGLEAGADDFITKPFNRAELRARARSITRLSRYRRLHDAQMQWRASEERYRELFNSMDEGFCLIEVLFDQSGKPFDYRFLELNPSFEKQTGLLHATGKRVRELIPTIEADWIERMGAVALTGESTRFVNRLEALHRWFDIHAFRVGGPSSRNVAILFSDITARIAAEKSLQASEARFRALFDLVPVAIYTCDGTGMINEFNRRAVELWGQQPRTGDANERWCGSYKLYLPNGTFLPREQCPTVGVVNGITPGARDVELTAERPDGSRIFVLINIAPIKNERGEISGAVNCIVDITERKRSRDLLQVSESRYRRLFEAAQDGVLILNAETGMVDDVNPFLTGLLGLTKEQFLRKKVWELGCFKNLVANQEKFAELQRNEYVRYDDLPLEAADGHLIGVEFVSNVYESNGSKVIQCNIRDMTERKRAAAALREVDARYQKMLVLSPDAIFVHVDGIITFANEAFCQLVGAAGHAQLLGRAVLEMVHPDHHNKLMEAARLEDAPMPPGEMVFIGLEGNKIDVDVASMAFNFNGRREVQVIARDISKRKQAEAAEAALRETERSLEEITIRKREAEQSMQAIRELNDVKAAMDQHAIVAITNARGEITYVNDKFCAISKYSRSELLGKDHRIINSGHHPKAFIEQLWQTINSGQVWKGEIKNKAKDGSYYWVDTTIVPYLDESGRPVQYIAIRADITERKDFEQALQETNIQLERAKSMAEKANLAKSEFLSSMSHELRSPLNAILGFAQVMEVASPPPTASQAKRISQILKAGWYLLQLINDILDLAVIEAGKISLSPEPVSLSEVMSECQAMVETEARQRGIVMTFPLFDTPVFVNVDRIRLKQIILNLLSNALKYNKEQGKVVVDCVARARERIRFTITDSGAGLPPEKLAQLFQPFNRLGQEAGRVAGTGIGLVVTKRLAELMGGAIGVESTVGVGSSFWCELNSVEALRLGDTAVETTVPLHAQSVARTPLHTLLYVEDNPANMLLMEELIALRPDILLLTAIDATLGLKLAHSAHVSVILMDINLPGLTGLEALRILREDPATAHIPVVALSANAMDREIAKGIDAGFFRYLTKPIKIDEFMETLNAALALAEKSKNGHLSPKESLANLSR